MLDVDELAISATEFDSPTDEPGADQPAASPQAAPRPAPARKRPAGKRRSSSSRKRSSPSGTARPAAAKQSLSAEQVRAAKIYDTLASWTIMARMERPDAVDVTDAEIDEIGPPLSRILARHMPAVDLPANPDVVDAGLTLKGVYAYLVRIGKLPSPLAILGLFLRPHRLTFHVPKPTPKPKQQAARPGGVEPAVPNDPVPSAEQVLANVFDSAIE